MENLLKPSKFKLVCHLFVVLVISIVLFLGFKNLVINYGTFSVEMIITVLFINLIAGFVIYYPLTSSAIFIFSSIRNKIYNAKKIIIAIIMILIFNPLTLNFIINQSILFFAKNKVSKKVEELSNKPCGLVIVSISDYSKVDEAGLGPRDMILGFDSKEVETVEELLTLLDKHKPGDEVVLTTDQGDKMVELVSSLNDPNHAVLGVNLIKNPYCKTDQN